MALQRADRIKENTTTTGTGTISLSGTAPTGFRTFVSAVTSLATVRYLIELPDQSEWEVGEGVFTDGTPDTLTRVTVYASSNAGSKVDFSAGTKNVSLVFTANDISTSSIGDLIGSAGDATPNDTDYVATALTAGGLLKKITWTNVKAFLKTYFDTLYLSLSGGTLTGDIQLGETDIKLDAVLSADEKWSGIVIAGVLGATIAVGDLCYLNADDSRWELVDANLSDGYDKQLGICVLAGNDGSATEMLVYGKIRSAAFPAFTVGSPLYMSETAGDITHTAPTTADSATRKVGIAITAEDLLFNPSNDYYTHI
jgi:hypothetical protein